MWGRIVTIRHHIHWLFMVIAPFWQLYNIILTLSSDLWWMQLFQFYDQLFAMHPATFIIIRNYVSRSWSSRRRLFSGEWVVRGAGCAMLFIIFRYRHPQMTQFWPAIFCRGIRLIRFWTSTTYCCKHTVSEFLMCRRKNRNIAFILRHIVNTRISGAKETWVFSMFST